MVEYRGVTVRGSGFQAQVTGQYLGWRKNKKQAALLVAAKERTSLGAVIKTIYVKPKRPLRTRKLMRPLRTHKWIYWLAARGVWQVKLPNQTSFTAPTLPLAVARAGKVLRRDPKSFKLKAPHAQDHGRFSAQSQIEHVFRMVWGSYQRGPTQAKHKFACVPADAAYTYKFLRGPKAKPTQDPGMVFHYLMAKDGPGKDAVSDAIDNVKPKRGKCCPKDLEELDYNRTGFALRHLSKNHDPEESKQWNKGPGKGTAHKMGLAMWAKKNLKILREGRGKGSFPIGKTRKHHMIVPLTKAVRSKFRKTRAYGEALLRVKDSKLLHLKAGT